MKIAMHRNTFALKQGAALRTCLSTDGLLSFLPERFPSTLKFALPWDDFKTARREGEKKIKIKPLHENNLERQPVADFTAAAFR